MAFKHHLIDGERVSWPLWVGLTAARKSGLLFHVNEGRRTMLRQAELVREKGLYNRLTNPTGAAWPSPTAPHIKVGRWDHALDLVNAQGVIDWFRRVIGVRLVRTVSTEWWHVEIDPRDKTKLVAWARHWTKRARVLRFGMRGEDVEEYMVKLRYLGFLTGHVSKKFNRRMRAAVKRFQRSHKLASDGKIGPKTRAAIDRAYARRTQ